MLAFISTGIANSLSEGRKGDRSPSERLSLIPCANKLQFGIKRDNLMGVL